MYDQNSNGSDWQVAQLARDTRDAKRAPEIAAWLRDGPLPITTIIELRRLALLKRGMSPSLVGDYSTASVMHDLGRLAGLGGPVVYSQGWLWLNEAYRSAVEGWAGEESARELSTAANETDPADVR